MNKHPLDDVFNIDGDGEMVSDFVVDIPEDPTLDTIIDFALKAYKAQMEDISLIEPSKRTKYLEISERFLGQAKDAIHKKEALQIQRDKASATKRKTGQPEVEGDSGDGIARGAMFDKLSAIQGGKK